MVWLQAKEPISDMLKIGVNFAIGLALLFHEAEAKTLSFNFAFSVFHNN